MAGRDFENMAGILIILFIIKMLQGNPVFSPILCASVCKTLASHIEGVLYETFFNLYDTFYKYFLIIVIYV